MAGQRRLRREHHTVGWVWALPIELAAAPEMLDEKHETSSCDAGDPSLYTLGCVGGHIIVSLVYLKPIQERIRRLQ